MATISGGNGNDTITGTSGNDVIYGGNGDDIIFGGAGNDTIHGGNGADVIHGGEGDDTLYGDNGDDYITGDGGNDNLYGGLGNDILDGNSGNNTLYGESGNDLFLYTARENINSTDSYDGGSGADKLRLVLTSAEKAYFDANYKTAFEAWLGHSGTFVFNGFGNSDTSTSLTLKSIESYEIIISNPTTNTPPDAKNVIATINEDQSITFYLGADHLATDADGNPLTITKLWTSTNTTGVGPGGTLSVSFTSGSKTFTGYATLAADGQSFTFTATGHFDALQTSDALATGLFMYTVSDGQGGFDDAAVNMNVSGVNDAPTAANDSFTVPVDAASTTSVVDPRTNDTDPENDSLSVTAVSNLQHGTAFIISSGPDAGKISFTAEKGYVGPAGFQYTISDGHGGTSVGTVSLSLQPMFHGNVATNYTTTAFPALTVPASGSVNMIAAGLSVNHDNTFTFAQAVSPNPVSIVTGIDSNHINEIYATLTNGSLAGGEINIINLPNYDNTILWRGGTDQWLGSGSLTVNAGTGHNTLTLNNQLSPASWLVPSNAGALIFNFGTSSSPDAGNNINYSITVTNGTVNLAGGSVAIHNYSAFGAVEDYHYDLHLVNTSASIADFHFTFTDLGLGTDNYTANISQYGGTTTIASGSVTMLRGNGEENVSNTFQLDGGGQLVIGAPATAGPSVTFTTGNGNSTAVNNFTIGSASFGSHVTIYSGSFALDIGNGTHNFTNNFSLLGASADHSTINISGGSASFHIGDGNNTITTHLVANYGDITISGGSVTASMGNGNNTFTNTLSSEHSSLTITGGSLTASIGNGNNSATNTISVNDGTLNVSGGSAALSAGDGNNSVSNDITITDSSAHISGGTVNASVGNGSNSVSNHVTISGSDATISGGSFTGVVGGGDNHVTNHMSIDTSTLTVTGGSASLTVGDGDNTVDSTVSISDSSADISNGSLNVVIGNGANTFTGSLTVSNSDTSISGGTLHASIGDGNNSATLSASISDSSLAVSGGSATVSAGSGDNSVTTHVTISNSTANISGGTLNASVGDGDNTVDNTVSISGSHATISGGSFTGVVGGGDNHVTNHMSIDTSTLTVTGGSASLTVGDGDNTVDSTVSISDSSADISNGSLNVVIGNGANTFTGSLTVSNSDTSISGGTLHASIGDGDNSATLTASISDSSLAVSGGSATVSAGSGDNSVTTHVTISNSTANISGGTLNASVGDGDNTVDNTVSISGSHATISGGSFTGVVGDGDNHVTNHMSIDTSTLTVTGGSASLTVGDGDNTVDSTVSISDSSADISNGSLNVVIGDGANTFTGSFTVSNSDATISGGTLHASIGDGNNSATLSASISDSSLTVSGGSATVSLGNGLNTFNNSFSASHGSANISGGTLSASIGDGNNFAQNIVGMSNSTLIVSGGLATLHIGDGNNTVNNTVNISSNSSAVVTGGSFTAVVGNGNNSVNNNLLVNSSNAVITGGSFTASLGNGNNTATNLVAISDSSLIVGGGSSSVTVGHGSNTVTDVITISNSVANISGGSAAVTIHSGASSVNTYNNTSQFTNNIVNISGGSLTISDDGAGASHIDISATQTGGSTTVTGGSASISSASGLVTTHDTLTLDGGGTVVLGNGTTGPTVSLSAGNGIGHYDATVNIGSGSGSGHLTINSGSSLTATVGNGNNVWVGHANLIGSASDHSTITVNGGFAHIILGDGNNSFTLSASSTYGDISIHGGTAILELGDGNNTFVNSLTADHSSLTITGGSLTASVGNGNNSATNTILVNDGTLTVSGGTATLSAGGGSNSLSNDITITNSSAHISGGTLNASVGSGDNTVTNDVTISGSSALIEGGSFVGAVGNGTNTISNTVLVETSSLTVTGGSALLTIGSGSNTVTDSLNISNSTANISGGSATVTIHSGASSVNTYNNTSEFTNNTVNISGGTVTITDDGAGADVVNLNLTQHGGSTTITGGTLNLTSASGDVTETGTFTLNGSGSIVIGTPSTGPTVNLVAGNDSGSYTNNLNLGSAGSYGSFSVYRAILNATLGNGNNTIVNALTLAGNAANLSQNSLLLSGVVATLALGSGSNTVTNTINALYSTVTMYNDNLIFDISSNSASTNTYTNNLTIDNSHVDIHNVNISINDSGSGVEHFVTNLSQTGGSLDLANISISQSALHNVMDFPSLSFSNVQNHLSGININFGNGDDSLAIDNLTLANGSQMNIHNVNVNFGGGVDSLSGNVYVLSGSDVTIDGLHVSAAGALSVDLSLTINGAGSSVTLMGMNTIQGGSGDFDFNFTLNLGSGGEYHLLGFADSSQTAFIGGTGTNTLNLTTNITGGTTTASDWLMDYSHSTTNVYNPNISYFIEHQLNPFLDDNAASFVNCENTNIINYLNTHDLSLILANDLGNLVSVVRYQTGGDAHSIGTQILGGSGSDHYIALDDLRGGTLTLENETISLGAGNDTYFCPDLISGNASVFDKTFIIDLGTGNDIGTYSLVVTGGTMRLHDSSLQGQDAVTINLPWKFSGDTNSSFTELRDITWGNTSALTTLNMDQQWLAGSNGTALNTYYITGDDLVSICKGYYVQEFSVSNGVLSVINGSAAIFGGEIVNVSTLNFTAHSDDGSIFARLDFQTSTNPYDNVTAARNFTTVTDAEATVAANGLYAVAAGYHVVDATSNDDTVTYIQGTYTANGEGGDDTVDFSQSAAGLHDFFLSTAGGGDNQVVGGDLTYFGTDAGTKTTVIGNPTADNTFNVTAGTYAFIGGSGTDLVNYSTAGAGVNTSLGNGAVYTSVEDLTGTPFDDTLTGNMINNTITGLRGSDTMDGGSALLTDIDTARYDDEAFAITVVQTGPVNYEVTRDEGFGPVTDYLSNIEIILASPVSLADTVQGPDSNQSWTLAIDASDGKSTVSNPSVGTFKDFDILNGGTADDSLTIDLANGNPILSTGFAFNGGASAGFDSINIINGNANIIYTFTNANDGTISIDDGGGPSVLTYTGLDPIYDTSGSFSREFIYNGSAGVSVDDIDSSTLQLSSFAAETVQVTKQGAIIINPNGNTVSINDIDGDFELDLNLTNASSSIVFSGVIGGDSPLQGIFSNTAPGNITINASAITTTGAQDYAGAVTQINVSTVLTSQGFEVAFIGDSVIGGGGLTIYAPFAQLGQNNTSINIGPLDVYAASTLIGAESLHTGGDQVYHNDISLAANGSGASITDTVLSAAGNITFDGTINDNELDATSSGFTTQLVVSTTGSTSVTFNGAVGNSTQIDTLDVTSQAININGGLIKTFGDQYYHSSVFLGADTQLVSLDSGDITLANFVNGSGYDLNINTNGVTSLINGAGGDSLTILGATHIGGVGSTSFSVDYATFNAPVTLFSGSVNFSGIDTTFNSTLNGSYDLYSTASNSLTFNGAVGTSSILNFLFVYDTPTGAVYINGGEIDTLDAQSYNNPIYLGSDTLLLSVNSSFSFAGGVIDNGHSLTLASGTTDSLFLVGAGGNDTLYYDNAASVGNYDGGAGTNTLMFNGTGNLSSGSGSLSNLDILNLTDSNFSSHVASVLGLSNGADTVSISGSTINSINGSHALTINGDASDTVHITGGNTWTDNGVSAGFHNYSATDVTASLSISTNITNVDFT